MKELCRKELFAQSYTVWEQMALLCLATSPESYFDPFDSAKALNNSGPSCRCATPWLRRKDDARDRAADGYDAAS